MIDDLHTLGTVSRRVFAVATILCAAACTAAGQEAEKPREPMPIYITPFYDSKGIQVEVGEFSKKLAQADEKTILDVAAEMKKQQDHLRPEAMYVLAIRLYDLNHKDKSVYWFYSAQYRARLFRSILDKAKLGGIGEEGFELVSAYNAFLQLSGTYINGYAFGHLDKLDKTLQTVVEEGKQVPDLAKLYPRVNFVPAKLWAERNQEVAKGIESLREYILSNVDEIREQRRKNKVDGKY